MKRFLVPILAMGAAATSATAPAQNVAIPNMLAQFQRGNAVIAEALEAAGGAQAIRELAALRFTADGEVSNDLQNFVPDRVGNPERDGPYRIETAFEFTGGRFFQRLSQTSRGGYGLDTSSIFQDKTFYLLRHNSSDYTQTSNAPSPFGPGSAGLFNMRLAPVSLLKRAQQNFRSVTWAGEGSINGAAADMVDFSFDESVRLRLYITRSDHRVRRVDALAAESLAGDDISYNLYEGDQTVAGLWFPERVTVNRRGVRVLSLALRDISLGPLPDSLFAVPTSYVLATDDQPQTVNVLGRIYEVGGLGGGLFRIQFVIMEDFIVAFEAGGSYQTAQAAINAIRRIEPNKPIRYAVMSHFHNDHSGGLGAYVDAGATIIGSPVERDIYARYAAARSQFQGQGAARANLNFQFIPVSTKGYEIVDAAGRKLKVMSLSGAPHVDRLLALYDPEAKAIITADFYSPLVRFNETFSSFTAWLRQGKLPVDLVLGSHHAPATRAELLERDRVYRQGTP